MGLDMNAYAASKCGVYREYWDDYTETSTAPHYIEIAYWRKHPNLHGWMQRLWESKGYSGTFNGDELELTNEDLDCLERDVLGNNLPNTSGFFFGSDADDYYKEKDLQFIKDSRLHLFLGLRVFYNSSW